jgi:hypothetical protein
MVTLRPGPWSLCDLAQATGFVGAVAAEGDAWTLRCWHYGADIPQKVVEYDTESDVP